MFELGWGAELVIYFLKITSFMASAGNPYASKGWRRQFSKNILPTPPRKYDTDVRIY